MVEKILVTNYDGDEIITMIREAFSQELKGIIAEFPPDQASSISMLYSLAMTRPCLL